MCPPKTKLMRCATHLASFTFCEGTYCIFRSLYSDMPCKAFSSSMATRTGNLFCDFRTLIICQKNHVLVGAVQKKLFFLNAETQCCWVCGAKWLRLAYTFFFGEHKGTYVLKKTHCLVLALNDSHFCELLDRRRNIYFF